MTIGSIKIIFLMQSIDFLADMFRFENISEDITQKLKNESKKTIRQATDITGEVYDNFLKEQQTISIKMELQSPEIVLPINFKTKKGPSLVFWPGNLTVIDGLTEKLQLEQESSKSCVSEQKREIYDSYNIRLEKMELEYCKEFRMAKSDLFDKGLHSAIQIELEEMIEDQSQKIEDEVNDEYEEKFALQKRKQLKKEKAEIYIDKRNLFYHSMFRDFSIGVKIELLKNIFVQLECSDARKKITAELSSLKLEANPEIVNELMKLTQMFVLNEEEQNRMAKKRNLGDAIKMDYLEVLLKGSPDLYFVIACRTKMFFYKNIKQDDKPSITIDFEDMPDLAFNKAMSQLIIKRTDVKENLTIKFSKVEDYDKWVTSLKPIKKTLAIKRMKFEEEEKIRKKKLKMRQGII